MTFLTCGRADVPPARTVVAAAVAATALLLAFAVVLTAPASTAATGAYGVVSVGGAGVAWIGVRRRRGVRGTGLWVALTLTLNAVADIVWQAVSWVTGTAPDVSVADAFYLASYLTLAAALVGGWGGDRRPGDGRYALLDGAAVLTAALVVVYQSSIAGILTDAGHGALVRLVWIGYPVLDAVLIGLLVWRIVRQGRVRRSAVLLLSGVLCWLAADLGMLAVGDADAISGGLNVGWLAGVVLLAFVPWLRPAGDPGVDPAGQPGRGMWRTACTVAPFAVPAIAEVVTWARGGRVDPIPTVVAWAVLLVLSSVRTRLLTADGERAWAQVRSQARRSEVLALTASDAVAVMDPGGRLTGGSASVAGLLGRPACAGEDFPGLLAALGVVPVAVHTVLDRARRRPGTPVELELEGRTPDGGPRWLGGRAVDLSADPDVAGIVVSVYDITRRKIAEQELAHQAFHDELTGLANRSLFLDRAEQALRRTGRTGGAPTLLCLDLDGFKDVNDSLGHLAGDTLLREVARRLRATVRPADTVARLGGDEFAVLVDDAAGGPSAAAELAERLLAALREPVELGHHRVSVGASIGVVPAEPASTPLRLLQDGDIAMYQAKSTGRGRWVVFDPGMRAAALRRIDLERRLATALGEGQLRLVYQPVVELRTDRVVGFEALLRWQNPTLGAVGPDQFVPVAESSGLIVPIGRWVLAEATRTVAEWQRSHPGGRSPGLSVAVNVSPRQLAADSLVDDVAAALAQSGLPPSSLTLEITETALVTDPGAVAARLAELRRLGVRIALDDFGTGYSSLAHLREFPVDVLKIDRSFVRLLGDAGQDARIVHGIVQLAHALDLEVVAEGVEDDGQRNLLRAEQCRLAQGHLFSRPLEAADAGRLVGAAEPVAAG